MCREDCVNLRSFRDGFGGERIVFAYSAKEKRSTCALKQEIETRPRGGGVCWREAGNDKW